MPGVVRCADAGEYTAAVEQGRIAVIGELEPHVSVLQHAEPARDARPEEVRATVPGGVVLAADDPVCRAAARLLALRSGRSVLVAGDDVAAATGSAVSAGAASLTFVLPAWNSVPTSIEAALHAIRLLGDDAAMLPWGIVTGTRPEDLTRLAAKSVLHAETAARYDRCPSALFCTMPDPTVAAEPFARFDPDGSPAPLVLIDDAHVEDGSSVVAMRRRWSVLAVKAHGRPYCASRGHLCGARDLDTSPDADLPGCLGAMACVSAAFPQLDPRTIDASVIVLDACGTGNLLGPSWEFAIPSVAFHAAAGNATSVITGDRVTMNRHGDFADVFWALSSAPTVGAAVANLNWVRRDRSGSSRFTYYLLGDPDVAAGPSRWGGWASDGAGTPYRSVACEVAPSGASDAAIHVAARAGAHDLRCLHAFVAPAGAQAWCVAPDDVGDLTATMRPVPALPPGTVADALAFLPRSESWTPLLSGGRARVAEAAARVLKVAQVLDAARGTATPRRLGDFDVIVDLAEDEWLGAQEFALDEILGFSPGGIWPYRFWSMEDVVTTDSAVPCPYCRAAPTMVRTYRSHPGLTRRQRECVRCDLIEDRPDEQTSQQVSLSVAPVLPRDGEAIATLTLTAAGAAHSGALAVLVDGSGHGVAANPARVRVTLAADAALDVRTRLSLAGAPQRPHLWRVRAVGLIGGQWFIVSRPLVVGTPA